MYSSSFIASWYHDPFCRVWKANNTSFVVFIFFFSPSRLHEKLFFRLFFYLITREIEETQIIIWYDVGALSILSNALLIDIFYVCLSSPEQKKVDNRHNKKKVRKSAQIFLIENSSYIHSICDNWGSEMSKNLIIFNYFSHILSFWQSTWYLFWKLYHWRKWNKYLNYRYCRVMNIKKAGTQWQSNRARWCYQLSFVCCSRTFEFTQCWWYDDVDMKSWKPQKIIELKYKFQYQIDI